MCLFKKKKKIINSKFQMGALVGFRYHDELTYGNVYEIKEENSQILYTIQVAGQCPWFVYNVKEEDLKAYQIPKVGK